MRVFAYIFVYEKIIIPTDARQKLGKILFQSNKYVKQKIVMSGQTIKNRFIKSLFGIFLTAETTVVVTAGKPTT